MSKRLLGLKPANKEENLLPTKNLIESAVQTIRNRFSPEGGFAMHGNEFFRPDSTAWAVMALDVYSDRRDLTLTACRRLAKSQLSDGRVAIIDAHPKSYWPTALSLMAWLMLGGFERESALALQFLLTSFGKHWPKKEDAAVSHDTSIKGWPWVENTHSWVEPTAMAVLALRACGYARHSRVSEAIKMILDRQLPAGGWNYGNTKVYGKILRPNLACTGSALSALSGQVDQKEVELSIGYLHRQIQNVRTPLTLSWAIFGLTAWSNRPCDAQEWILESLSFQKRYGVYNTVLLSQLVIAYVTSGDFSSLFD
jgi:squalene cyclase